MTETQKLWQPLAQQLVIPHDEASYQKLVAWLNGVSSPLENRLLKESQIHLVSGRLDAEIPRQYLV